MGVFSRFLDIVNANINSLLDKAEDPLKMLRMMIGEMEDTLVDIKSNCAERMAGRAKADREYRDTKASIDRWLKRAQLAVDKGRDDLAREALKEKKLATEHLARIEQELSNYDDLIKGNRKEIDQLEAKLDEVRKKYQMLLEKQRHEQERQHTDYTTHESPMEHFNSMEEKIDRMQARSDMNHGDANLEKEFSDLEKEDDIEAELHTMKQHKDAN